MDVFYVEPGVTLRDVYKGLCEFVLAGSEVRPRGQLTKERVNAVIVMDDMHQATLPTGIGRGVGPQVLAAEAMQWLAGVSSLEQLKAASSVFARFSDDGKRLNGAYGPRSHHGLAQAVRSLADDPDSRQAVVSVWNNHEVLGTRDLPCTVNWSFLIRGERLHMTTFMRSNDVWTGVAYDVPAMARIGSAVASALDLRPGSYTHHAQSLHIYEKDWESVEKLRAADGHAADAPFFDGVIFPDRRMTAVDRWDDIVNRARDTLHGVGHGIFAWYADQLRSIAIEEPQYFCVECRCYTTDEVCSCLG